MVGVVCNIVTDWGSPAEALSVPDRITAARAKPNTTKATAERTNLLCLVLFIDTPQVFALRR
jgi:hypothetical protein